MWTLVKYPLKKASFILKLYNGATKFSSSDTSPAQNTDLLSKLEH